MRSRLTLVVLTIMVAAVLSACGSETESGGGDDGGGGRAVTVTASGFAFDPTSVPAEPGEELEITLTNGDDVTHSFTVEDPSFEIEAEGGAEATGSFTVPDSGGVEFFCKFHDQMKGTIGATDAGGGGMETEDDKKKDDTGSDTDYNY